MGVLIIFIISFFVGVFGLMYFYDSLSDAIYVCAAQIVLVVLIVMSVRIAATAIAVIACSSKPAELMSRTHKKKNLRNE